MLNHTSSLRYADASEIHQVLLLNRYSFRLSRRSAA